MDIPSAHAAARRPVGLFYAWWRGDPLPELEPLDGFSLRAVTDQDLLAAISDLNPEDVTRRLRDGHQPYLAVVDGQPAAYGWSAHRQAEIGELGLTFQLPEGNRYLWDFVTLPDWRGKGIYPRMLQGIIQSERDEAERFWIGHDLENEASARGIEKAGIPVVGEVWIGEGGPVLVARQPRKRAEVAAWLLDLPFAEPESVSGDDKARG